MYKLDVEKRDKLVKAKKLRKNGIVPCSVYGGKLKETVMIQMQEGEARKLLKSKAKGGNVLLTCGADEWNVLVKDVSHNAVNNQIEDIVFENLVADEVINSTAQVVLKNRDKVPTMAQLILSEIPYKALPSNIVETVEIDLAELKIGDRLKVEQLSISQNPAVEVLLPAENIVLNIVGNARA
ncbi:50S ribosomal protein L25 [Lachnospiraceae bacterium LCP25S3_G4]